MPSEVQPPAETKPASKLSSPSISDELNEIQSPQPADGKINSENGVAQTLTSKNPDDTSTPDKADAKDDLKLTSHLKVVSPTDSKIAAVTDDSQQQKDVIDLLDVDGDDNASNEKPSHQENKGNKETAKTDLIDLSGAVELSNSGARPECIDLSRIDEPVTNSNEVIVID